MATVEFRTVEPADNRTSSLVAAAFLALLTLLVFAYSKNRGPISAVSRFNRAVANRDLPLLASVSLEDTRNPAVQVIFNNLSNFLTQDTPVTYALESKQVTTAKVYATYELRGRGLVPLIFAVRKTGNRWVVDSGETLNLRVQRQRG